MNKSITERVIPIVAEQLGTDADSTKLEDSIINDLGGDSLDNVELVMAIEEEFDFEIPDEEAEKLLTVRDFVNYVTDHYEQKRA